MTEVTDEMVETAWAAIVGDDIAKTCFNASIIRADLKTGLTAALAANNQEAWVAALLNSPNPEQTATHAVDGEALADKIHLRQTMRAEMKPDVYDGPDCDQVLPRWWTYADGDKEGGFEHEPLTLDARLFPPGTVISVKEPVCPKCEDSREPNYEDGKYLPGFVPKCRCGFDWDNWTAEQYS